VAALAGVAIVSDQGNPIRRFLEAAIELEDYEGEIISVLAIAEHMGLDEELSKKIMDIHIQRRNLALDPGTDEPEMFTVTQKGRYAHRSPRVY
jgi:hypothetical protein